MIDRTEAWERLVRHLVEASDEGLKAEEVQPETRLREDLGLGSLQAITLLMDLEDELEITVEDDEIEELLTVGDIADLLQRKLEGAASERGS